jgi:NADH-quinone oxidoreductase subunit L
VPGHGAPAGLAATSADAVPGQAGPAGVLKTHAHVDPQDMLNMGGLRTKMPRTFWTFLIGGFALAGFPLLTAGFWSKDEIFAEAFAGGRLVVFGTLALAALLTAFYTMRQITLTFLGQPRSEAAGHAHESKWTMTLPLIVLSVFAVAAGWVGIPHDFPLIGGWLPNWMHDFVGGTLLEHPHPIEFSPIPLLTSIGVSLLGLLGGWLVYRNVKAGAPDPLVRALGPLHTLLKNKYYFDELYDRVIVAPAYWLAETFTYQFLDRKVIDGFLHAVAEAAGRVGSFLRGYIDLPIVNGAGDAVGEGVKRAGRSGRVIQTGRVQGYLVVGVAFIAVLLSYVLLVRP